MKYLVLLAGCGLGDGSCIEEVILTYAALDKYGCDYTPVAEDIFVQSVNHLTEQIAEKRNILIESARVGRGRIKDIREVDFAEYDALIIPGGIGLLNNYRDSNVIKTCVTHFISEKKPVAAMCAGIDFLRRFYGSNLLAREMKELTAEKFCFDAENNVYYTPAFRKTSSSYMLGFSVIILPAMVVQHTGVRFFHQNVLHAGIFPASASSIIRLKPSLCFVFKVLIPSSVYTSTNSQSGFERMKRV